MISDELVAELIEIFLDDVGPADGCTRDEAREALRECLAEGWVKVIAVAPGVFKFEATPEALEMATSP